LRQEIGLGQAKSIFELEIFWPTSGTRQTFQEDQSGQLLHDREDASEPVLVKLKTFKLAAGAPAKDARAS